MNTPRTYAKSPELEAAVIADPENDLPRLVYADWLDEHDDPHRAAFIRAQCALWDKNPADDDYPDWIESREEVSWTMRHRTDLEPELPDGIKFHGSIFHRDDEFNSYHRGFPYFAELPVAASDREVREFIAGLAVAVKTTSLRGVRMEDGNPRVLACPAMRAMSAVHASAYGTDPQSRQQWAKAIAKSPCVPTLRWLHLAWVANAKEAETLAGAQFTRLTRFDGGVDGPPAVFKKLFAAPWMAGVRQMTTGAVADRAWRLLACLSTLPSLHTLQITPDERLVEAFGEGVELPALASLDMSRGHNPIQAIAPLAQACLPMLRSLSLGREFKNADLVRLFGADWFAGLNRLSLNCPKLGDKAFLALAKSPVSDRLRHLYLGTGSLTEKSFDALATGFGSLSMLSLFGSNVRGVTAATFAKFLAKYANPNLRSLAMSSGWPLDDKGLIALAKNPAFSYLRVLDIRDRGVTWKGIKAVLTSPHLQELRALQLGLREYDEQDKKILAQIADVLKDPGVMPHLVGWR